MTFGEFKAWLEGYRYSFKNQDEPEPYQWEMILKKLDEVVVPVLYPPIQIPLWSPSPGWTYSSPTCT